MKLFPDNETIEVVSTDILSELNCNKNGNGFLFVITDRLIKLTRNISIKPITATAVAHSFVQHWVLIHGPPKTVLSDDGSQVIARFFREMCRTFGTNDFHSKAYYPQFNDQGA